MGIRPDRPTYSEELDALDLDYEEPEDGSYPRYVELLQIHRYRLAFKYLDLYEYLVKAGVRKKLGTMDIFKIINH